MNKTYLAIDLKSFYASVECVERNLDPLTTNLVVADQSRCTTTICLAVSPSLKAFGVSSRPRLFEVIQKVKEINYQRQWKIKYDAFQGKSYHYPSLIQNPYLELDYIVAIPRMALYMKYSSKIYQIYLKYIAPEDIHVYSIDEVFIDITPYLKIYQKNAHDLAMMIIKDVLHTTGITATVGIGSNMYLAKVAMDIVAKKMPADQDGVRIATLDEMSYRQTLWDHTPITDFWRVGAGYAKKLAMHGIYTMGDIAKCSLNDEKSYHNEALLYKLFGVNAELLIDHAWGYEPCTIKDVKSYVPQNHSLGSGQVLHEPYTYEKAKIILIEMIDQLSLDLVDKKLVCDQIVLTIGYDIENLKDPRIANNYHGEICIDHYGRKIPKHAHGSINLKIFTSSSKMMREAIIKLYDRIINPKLTIRRINISLNHILHEDDITSQTTIEQLDLFQEYQEENNEEEVKQLKKEKDLQQTLVNIKKKFGKNAVLKGTNLQEGATTKQRNEQIGGHKA